LYLDDRSGILCFFFDVHEVYDQADVRDMMQVLWKNGVKGKIWRLIYKLNENLTSTIKNRYGEARKIMRQTSGKQGSSLMVDMFSKLIDTLSEEAMKTDNLGINVQGEKIPGLLWVDDIASLAEGYDQQEGTLKFINELSRKHKLQFGAEKCQAMEIGRHRNVRKEWKLGDQIIKHIESYRYLGDIVQRNGGNVDNIENRRSKASKAALVIITCCRTPVMDKLKVDTIICLHESISVSALICNSEAWIRTKTDEQNLEKIEIKALKRILMLPEKHQMLQLDLLQELYSQKPEYFFKKSYNERTPTGRNIFSVSWTKRT
jgi:hypothetical protein